MKTITLKSSPESILKQFRDCGPNESINLKTPNGFISLTRGILSKLEGSDHYIAMNGKWTQV